MTNEPALLALYARPYGHKNWGRISVMPRELIGSPYQATLYLTRQQDKWNKILLDHEFKIDEDKPEAYTRNESVVQTNGGSNDDKSDVPPWSDNKDAERQRV